MTDLKAFTRDLVSQMGSHLGTRLNWVAIDQLELRNPICIG